jgi:hypothetical protein
MTIRRSEGAEWLITGRASGKVSDPAQIADALARIWEEHLRYSYRSAHTVGTDTDSVSLRAVTQGGPNGIWVTAYIQVALPNARSCRNGRALREPVTSRDAAGRTQAVTD